jgi:MinD superfamily P-loop ATPase
MAAKTITIVSGKGGVGKSSITASLAILLAKKKRIVTADCDVDAPNLNLVFGLRSSDFNSWKELQTNEKARLISMKGIDYKKCIAVCNFGAISYDGKRKKLIFNKFLCEGCGSCQLLYPKNIRLVKIKNARIGIGKTRYGFDIVTGQLKMGESGSGKIVTEVKNMAEDIAKKENADLIIADGAPGIGCPVIASIQGSDYVIAVTEPTPSGLSDLKRVLKVVEHFNIPKGIVINQFDINRKFSDKIISFAKKNKIPVLKKIPYNRSFVNALVAMRPVVEYDKGTIGYFKGIADFLTKNL